MASYLPSTHIKKIKGKISGIVHSRNKSGSILYPYKYVPYKRTGKQQICIGNVRKIGIIWSNFLSQKQYEAWNIFASMLKWYNKDGELYTPDGYLVFSTYNRTRVDIGLNVILDPPKNTKVQSFKKFSLDFLGDDDLNDILLFYKPAIRKDTTIRIFATKFLRASISKIKDIEYRHIANLDYSFISGKSIFQFYKSAYPEQFVQARPFTFKIGFKFVAVTDSTGITSEPYKETVLYRKNSPILYPYPTLNLPLPNPIPNFDIT